MNTIIGSNIEMAYIFEAQEYVVLSECIHMVTISHNYDNEFMPIILLDINLEANLYDLVVRNVENGLFRFKLQRYNKTSKIPMPKNDINGLFTYMMPTDLNYDKSLNFDKSHDSYKRVQLSLISLDNINNNHVFVNTVIRNTDMFSAVHQFTSHMNMVIEPFREGLFLDQFIIQPTSTVTQLINLFNGEHSFYDTSYRFFRDFNTTYLLSSAGNPVDDGDNVYDTINITVDDLLAEDNKNSGFIVDHKARSYKIFVAASDTNIDIATSENLQYNVLLAINDDGYVKKIDLRKDTKKDEKERYLIKRVNNYKRFLATLNSTTVILNIVKSELDGSLLTPNKEYLVRNYPSYSQYDGRYLLSYKKEVFLRQDGDFISSMIFGLRRVDGIEE